MRAAVLSNLVSWTCCSLDNAPGDFGDQRLQGGLCHILNSVPRFEHLILGLLDCSQLSWLKKLCTGGQHFHTSAWLA